MVGRAGEKPRAKLLGLWATRGHSGRSNQSHHPTQERASWFMTSRIEIKVQSFPLFWAPLLYFSHPLQSTSAFLPRLAVSSFSSFVHIVFRSYILFSLYQKLPTFDVFNLGLKKVSTMKTRTFFVAFTATVSALATSTENLSPRQATTGNLPIVTVQGNG